MQAQAGQAVILDIPYKIKLPLNFRLLAFHMQRNTVTQTCGSKE